MELVEQSLSKPEIRGVNPVKNFIKSRKKQKEVEKEQYKNKADIITMTKQTYGFFLTWASLCCCCCWPLPDNLILIPHRYWSWSWWSASSPPTSWPHFKSDLKEFQFCFASLGLPFPGNFASYWKDSKLYFFVLKSEILNPRTLHVQCDQVASLLFQYLAICKREHLPKTK